MAQSYMKCVHSVVTLITYFISEPNCATQKRKFACMWVPMCMCAVRAVVTIGFNILNVALNIYICR